MAGAATVEQFIGRVGTMASSFAPPSDRAGAILDELSQYLPFEAACVCVTPAAGVSSRTNVVVNRGYSERLANRLASEEFLEEWRGLGLSARGQRFIDVKDNDPPVETVADYIRPQGFGGGLSVPLISPLGQVGSMHFSTWSSSVITDRLHDIVCIIAPMLGNILSVGAERLPSAQRASRLGISARELEVLELAAHGRSNSEIAALLFISTRTVAAHVEHILRKLDVNNRTHAATIAVSAGLVSVDGSI